MSSEKRNSLKDIEERLDQVRRGVLSRAFEDDMATIAKLNRDESLLSLNSVNLLEFVMALETEFGLEVDDDTLSRASTLSFDNWVDYIHGRLKA
jgi:acyl carrier protein